MFVQLELPLSPKSTLFVEDSHAKTFQARVDRWASRVLARAFGVSLRESLTSSNQRQLSLKMLLDFCRPREAASALSLVHWPSSGTMLSGRAYQLRISAQATDEEGFSSSPGKLWPTLKICGNSNEPKPWAPKRGVGIRTAVGGKLNPDWLEALMDFPVGWTLPEALPVGENPSTIGSRRAQSKASHRKDKGECER